MLWTWLMLNSVQNDSILRLLMVYVNTHAQTHTHTALKRTYTSIRMYCLGINLLYVNIERNLLKFIQ